MPRAPLHQPLIDDRPPRVPGTAVFLTQSLETVPPGTLIDNAEHNDVRPRAGRPAARSRRSASRTSTTPDRVEIEPMRLGFVGVKARYGYQDEPDVVEALRLAQARGLDIDVDHALYYVDHVSLLPTGHTRFSAWRKRLYILLARNATPPARSYDIPPDRVIEIGSYVQL